MSIHVRAPASTANVGPGFDAAAVAFDLWNELEISEANGGAPDFGHLGVRAFARVTPAENWAFDFTTRIPRERGLGSSAAVIALGLVAGTLAAGREPDPEELLAVGMKLEGHPDNLAAALAGGVCLTWSGRIARIADDVPAVPIAVVPEETLATSTARTSLPSTVPHRDAAFTVGRAALLGAALASGSADLLAASLADRIHEPYRVARAPLLTAVRERLPSGALGVSLSGSGPSVVVWARRDDAKACEAELRQRFPEADVMPLRVAAQGAGRV